MPKLLAVLSNILANEPLFSSSPLPPDEEKEGRVRCEPVETISGWWRDPTDADDDDEVPAKT